MCGIIGIFNRKDAEKLAEKGLLILKNRGKDGKGIIAFGEKNKGSKAGKKEQKPDAYCLNALGHVLHSVVGHVKQPIVSGKGAMITANCEIYNWKGLSEKYNIKARNDAELLLKLIEKKGTGRIEDVLSELDGDYSFCYVENNTAIIARDIIGVKPAFYSHSEGFSFASEKKALEKLGFGSVSELNPRKILKYDIGKDRLEFIEREFFKILITKESAKKIRDGLIEKLTLAVKKRIPKKNLGILFSGGVDSTTLALICQRLGAEFTCYTAALDEPCLKEPEDLIYAKKAAELHGFKLKIKKIKLSEAEKYLKKVVPLIEDSNVTKAGVGLTFYPACELAKKDGIKVMLSGLGSEEIFAGYQRHKQSADINRECISGLLKLYERDTYRDDVITMENSLELRVPFLDKELIEFALSVPGELKIKQSKGDAIEKYILRLAAEKMGLAKEIAWRKKRAAQYGSRVHSAIEKLSHRAGFRLKSEYMRQFYRKHNLRLAALVSGGKDSLYAAYTMQRQNYCISCIVTMKSRNQSSYMFHTPATDLAELQAKAMEIPIIMKTTDGEKEKELKDLKAALKEAKERYNADGVVTGALYSAYQRDRVEKICDELGLKTFSPLWHINQETYMHELLDNGFRFIFTSIAAEGLTERWLGREITVKDVDALSKLNEKIGLNVAGEGGEYESFVFGCPMFRRPLAIKKGRKIMETENTGVFVIEEIE